MNPAETRGKKSAGEITQAFSITAAAISRHLSVLKEADLIRDQREGKYIFMSSTLLC
ncbi:MAG: ArsR family transcriptional regulator [Evtepia gabavorous]